MSDRFDDDRPLEQILEEYVDGLAPGEDIDLEYLIARYPERSEELREAVADWIELVGGVGKRKGPADESGGEGARSNVEDSSDGSANIEGRLRELQDRIGRKSRYEVLGEFARGGMGAILRVWDRDLRRTLAMKVVLGRVETERRGDTPEVDERTLGRFLEEAQVTGQLDPSCPCTSWGSTPRAASTSR